MGHKVAYSNDGDSGTLKLRPGSFKITSKVKMIIFLPKNKTTDRKGRTYTQGNKRQKQHSKSILKTQVFLPLPQNHFK